MNYNGTFCFRSMHFLYENTTDHFKIKLAAPSLNRWDQLFNWSHELEEDTLNYPAE